ncbi:2,4-dienoyl-CoA reductase, mitochondrial precursor [Phytophthora infestans T30-4]|uniref:2,4-dienoyl-CoA reductase, mitochondrial n=1 Tax=Phytophthora infestans (strain T30-4) TaxID=403677 RepID=D0NLR7_PHYIT|nr:2,4-dienoyl-CoA reductase, mitochondrial precursor [Phytophthora infestans T30-4]EEY60614.1 2,4-dienoyl-CoA reductase, mitochondrial precursor [Phytophthora infestans T30-4]|eukprot:XP_002899987.1 2,4-dienoyl-CoA reductase, mitochondrial precursor [Phytophthora infestans T30-4]
MFSKRVSSSILVLRTRAKSTAKPRSSPVLSTMLPPGTFKGKVALVTGGGTGLGKGIATKLSDLGATVAIMSRKKGVVDVAAKEIQEITGNAVIPLTGDVREPEQVKKALDELDEQAGIPTIVVNNAAGNFISPFERLNAKGFGTIVDIVLKGTANVTLDAGKRMIQHEQGGVFLNITTTYAETGSGYVVPSAAAKAGVSYGIRFVGIAPGPIKTKGAFDRLDPSGAFEEVMIQNNPLKRFGEVDELANLASYMTSDYASWLNGEIIRFDGGETVSNAGEFNMFGTVSKEKWDDLEAAIRDSNAKGKK